MIHQVDGLILAGGRSSRMAGINKALVPLHGKPLLLHVADRISSQVNTITVSANKDATAIQALGLPTVADVNGTSLGPLSGVLAGLRHAGSEWLLVVPTDMPLLPDDLVSRMVPAAGSSDRVAVAHDGQRRQNAVMLLHRDQSISISRYLTQGRSVGGWLDTVDCSEVNFSDQFSAFRNINSPTDLALLEAEEVIG